MCKCSLYIYYYVDYVIRFLLKIRFGNPFKIANMERKTNIEYTLPKRKNKP